MKKIWLVTAALLLGLSLWATPLTATWIDGKVEKQKGSAWVAINIGDTLDTSDTVRLAKGAMAEFSDGKRKLSLTSAGTFSLDALAKASVDKSGKTTAAVQKLAALVAPTSAAQGQTTAGGVRGDLIGAGVDQMSWAGDEEDPGKLMDEGKALVQEAKYDEAAASFGKAAAVADGDEKDRALYSQAWAFSAAGSSARAIKILRAMASTGAWAGPRAILLARLDIDTGSNDEAITVLNAALKAGILSSEDSATAQAMLKEAGATK